MKRYVLFCLLFLNTVLLFAAELQWHQGSVVLKTKEVLVGEISIEPHYDLILHRVNGKTGVYPAHKIQSLYFYDGEANINRKFISIKESGLFNRHRLFEIVLRGEISVYRRQKMWTEKTPSDKDGFDYYTYYHDQMIDLLKFRNQLYPYMVESFGSRISAFIDEHRLNPNFSADAIQIIQFYNRLEKDDEILAKH